MQKSNQQFITNLGLLISGIVTMFSGMLIQFQYHIGNHGNLTESKLVLGLSYNNWADIHKISITLLTILMFFHISLHWKWYKTVIRKRLFSKNIQVTTLTIVFVLAAITGFTPWIIDLLEGSEAVRKILIEVHDKLTIILSVYLIIHVMKRIKKLKINLFSKTN